MSSPGFWDEESASGFVHTKPRSSKTLWFVSIGEMRMLVKQVRKGRVTIEEAAEDAGMTVEEFKKILENTPLQAV